jgi:hypothetical protein
MKRISREEIPQKDVVLAVEQPLCAWCLSELGKPAGEGSHGICSLHANEMIKYQKERRNGRQKAVIS